jgi:uncharacterized protein (TIGR03435 family)
VGQFSMKLQWTPDDFQQKEIDLGASTPATEGRSLFSAIEEQVGLKHTSQLLNEDRGASHSPVT